MKRRHLAVGQIAPVVGSIGVVALLGGALALPMVVQAPVSDYYDINTVTVSSGDRVLVCPGAAQLTTAPAASSVTFDLELDSGADVIASTSSFVAVTPTSEMQTSGLVGTELRPIPQVYSVEATPTPRVGVFPPHGGEYPSVAGMTIGAETAGDLRGMVAASCAPPASTLWFIGGNTEIGSSTQLVLTNPGETAARVRVEGWSGLGPIPGEIVTLVEPGGSTVVLTETLQRTDRIALHVAAEGGSVAAYLLTTTLDGLIPGGVSYVTPSAIPGLETYVGPLRLEPATTTEWSADLRILNPGTDPAQISISLLGPAGEIPLAGAQDLTLEAGMLTSIPLAAEDIGDYTVWVQGDEPIVASVSTRAIGEYDEELAGTPADISWMASSHPTGDALLLDGPGAEYALTNPSPDPIEIHVEQIGESGNVTDSGWYEIAGSTTIALEAKPGSAGIRVHGAMVLASVQYYRDEAGPLIAHVPALGLTGGDQEIAVVAGN